MSYKVELDVYNGPMDLLLYLIRREEVDICEIEIARIADQYVAYLDALKALDIELAGDFVVMAATLLELKSRALLPRPPEVEDEQEGDLEGEDPRETLIRQLIEYRRYKEAAGLLSERGSEMARRFPRQLSEELLKGLAAEDGAEPLPQELLEGVEIWDLFSAFSQVIKTLGYSKPREVVYDETPVEEAVERLLARLQAEKSLLFVQLFDRSKGLAYAVTMFLALLELMRQRKVGIEQQADFKDIRLYLRDPETETYTQRKPKGAAESRDGLERKRPRRPTLRQRESLQEMMEDVEFEKTEFDEALEAIQVPEVEPFRPIYSEDELLGKKDEESSAPAAEGEPAEPGVEEPAAEDAADDSPSDAEDDEAPAAPADALPGEEDPDRPPDAGHGM